MGGLIAQHCSARTGKSSRQPSGAAFTLIELLTAMVILSLILVVVFSITQQAGNAWRNSRSKIETFQGARVAFQQITNLLGQATLNVYYDYFDSGGRTVSDSSFTTVDHFGRQSDLHFISGKSLKSGQISHAIFFQTPAGYSSANTFEGMDTLLNACGFYVEHADDLTRPPFLNNLPSFQNKPPRYRLMEFFQTSQGLAVYKSRTGNQWFSDPLASGTPPVRQLAQNVLALVILPKISESDAAAGGTALASDFEYDSRKTSNSGAQLPTENQLPPLVEVVMVAIDEASADRLGNTNLGISSLFQESDKLEGDLKILENALIQKHFVYRIFRTTVALRNSKWNS